MSHTTERISYVVQSWQPEPYAYWADVIESPATMFAIPVSSYATDEEAYQRRDDLLAQGARAESLRVIERLISETVI